MSWDRHTGNLRSVPPVTKRETTHDRETPIERAGAHHGTTGPARVDFGYSWFWTYGHLLPAAALTTATQKEDRGMQLVGELERRSQEGYVSSFWVAVAYLGLGQTDRVFEWLNRAYEERAPALVYFTREPMFDSVRADPRFTALISKMGLEERLSRS